ncbi:hypothetical protein [Planctomycetes bacterium K23_9]|uniref:Uncharacterized protein n=1 Tax=Stieleria marina TaxID=1930275 RepID=A0A517NTR8_9BACT|nr:hypothetical protein K239x_24590 [Planctomycetes bacterium K23_9]
MHSFLDEATPDNANSLFDSMPPDAQDAVLHHLGGIRRDYWSGIGTIGVVPYDPDAETTEDRAARFLKTIEVVLSSKQRKTSE